MAVIVAVVKAVTVVVVIVKLVLEYPTGTVTVCGTTAEGSLLDKATVTPPSGANPFRVTLPATVLPVTTRLGLSEREAGTKPTTKFPVTVVLLRVAVIVTVVLVATALVVIGKVVLWEPAGTVTVVGTVTEGSLLERLIIAPFVGAGPYRVTLPVTLLPPDTGFGLNVTKSSNGSTRRLVVTEVLLRVAVIVTIVPAVTALVAIGKVALLDPDGTVTVAATVTHGLPLERLTIVPPAGAEVLK